MVLDRAAAAPRSLEQAARQGIQGGVDAVVFRVKDASLEEARPLAQAVSMVCRDLRAAFVVSHFVELALELQADAVHLGAGDALIPQVRAAVGPGMRIGYSAHSVEEAGERVAAGADYVFLGPVFPTPAKLRYGPPLGVGVVAEALRIPAPVVFIGGISPLTLPEVVSAGGRRVAAIAALQSVDDVGAAARQMKALLNAAADASPTANSAPKAG